MQDVATQGRTVLFVSHQLEALSNLCSRAIMLEKGIIYKTGDTEEVISTYLHKQTICNSVLLSDRTDRQGDGNFKFTNAWVENKNGNKVSSFRSGELLKIVAEYIVKEGSTVLNLDVAFAIVDYKDTKLIDFSNRTTGDFFHGQIPLTGKIECVIPKLPLNQNRYYFHLWAKSGGGLEDKILRGGFFDVMSGDYFGTGRMPDQDWPLLVEHNWRIINE